MGAAIAERIDVSRTQNSYTAELQAVAEALKRVNESIPPNSTLLVSVSEPVGPSGPKQTRQVMMARHSCSVRS